jgi:hypothetical protein
MRANGKPPVPGREEMCFYRRFVTDRTGVTTSCAAYTLSNMRAKGKLRKSSDRGTASWTGECPNFRGMHFVDFLLWLLLYRQSFLQLFIFDHIIIEES